MTQTTLTVSIDEQNFLAESLKSSAQIESERAFPAPSFFIYNSDDGQVAPVEDVMTTT